MTEEKVSIKVELSGADDSIRVLDALDREINIISGSTQKAGGGFSTLGSNMIVANQAASLLGSAFGTVSDLIKATIGSLEEAGRVEGLENAFQNLQGGAEAAQSKIEGLRLATQGLVTDTDLYTSANQAALLKVDDGSGKFEQLTEAAVKLGRATGQTAKEAIDSLIAGIGRNSTEMLDNLGIIVKVADAHEQYAAKLNKTVSQLTEQEKAEAFRAVAIEKVIEKGKELNAVQDTAATAFSRAQVSFDNLRTELLKGISDSDSLAGSLGLTSEKMNEIPAEEVGRLLGELAGTLISAGAQAVNFAQDIGTIVDKLTFGLIPSISEAIGAVGALGESLRSKGLLGSLNDVAEVLVKLPENAVRIAAGLQPIPTALGKIAEKNEGLRILQSEFQKLNSAIKSAKTEEEIKALGGHFQYLFEKANALGVDLKKLDPSIVLVSRSLSQWKIKTEEAATATGKLGTNTKSTTSEMTQAEKQTKKLDDEIERLTKSIEKTTGSDGMPEMADQIEEIAKRQLVDMSISAEEATRQILELSGAVRVSGGDLADFETQVSRSYQAIEELVRKIEKNKPKAGKGGKGGFFSDILGISDEQMDALTSDIQSSLGDALGNGIRGAFEGANGEDYRKMVSDFGGDVGGSFGTAIGDSIAPGFGQVIGPVFEVLGEKLFDGIAGMFGMGEEDPGTTARKEADKYFADLFDANRLSLVIDGQLRQISDLVFKGETLFGGNVDFADGTFDDYLSSLPAIAQQAFGGVGLAFERLLDNAGVISGQIGAVIANNIGGDLNNLQVLVKSTGMSFDQLKDATVDAFLKGEISASQAQSAMIGIQTIAEDGIPGALGDVVKAFKNVQDAGSKGGAYLIDAIQDVGFEAKELGLKTFPELQDFLLKNSDFTAEQIQQVFGALSAAGITSVDQLTSATTEQLLPALSQLEQVGFLQDIQAKKDQLTDLIQQVDSLPDKIEKRIVFNVETRTDSNTQQFASQGGFASADIRGPGLNG